MKRARVFLAPLLLLTIAPDLLADDRDHFQPMDVFRLEFAVDPQISPDGKRVVYARNFMDIKKDRRRSDLWIIDADGSNHRALTSGDGNHHMPRWSPDGKRLVYLSSEVTPHRRDEPGGSSVML